MWQKVRINHHYKCDGFYDQYDDYAEYNEYHHYDYYDLIVAKVKGTSSISRPLFLAFSTLSPGLTST